MNHIIFLKSYIYFSTKIKSACRVMWQAVFSFVQLFLCVFALLVSNTAGCFASGLARCLAFAAATVLYGFVQVASCDSFDSAHIIYLP
jgi:hypothetical protein